MLEPTIPCLGSDRWMTTALHKFNNFYGQKNFRWRRDQPLYEDQIKAHSRLLSILSPFLFYSPQQYLHSLRTILSGDYVFSEAWRDFVQELHAEWNNLTIIVKNFNFFQLALHSNLQKATVFLTTNVAFLAIQSVDKPQNGEPRTAIQILSYVSTVSSVGSVLMGQIIARYHRIKGWENLDERVSCICGPHGSFFL